MTDEDLINEINSMVAALVHYASVAVSLKKNIGKPVETLMMLLLSEIEGRTLVNTNLSVPDSKAIDLADMKNRIAFQITTNADRAKWEKTDETLKKNKMIGSSTGQFTEIRVIGFCKHTKPSAKKQPPSYLRVEGLGEYLGKLSSLNSTQLSKIADGLRASYNFSRLYPLADEHCFSVFHRFINRDALRHAANFEGSFANQAQAFKEIRVLMYSGKFGTLRSKSIEEYHDQEYLNLFCEIDGRLGIMLAEIYKMQRAQSNMFSTLQGYQDFENARMETIDLVNQFCIKKNLQNLQTITPVS